MGASPERNDLLNTDIAYKSGNTTVIIVAPRITKEENEKRWLQFCTTASQIAENMIARGEL